MDTAGTNVAGGQGTPISCPSCGGEVHAILTKQRQDELHLLPCDHDVSLDDLLGKSETVRV